jgi:hypothetical protein
MSAENPPTYNFNGIDFNPSFYVNETTSTNFFTEDQANALYLRKTINDTATGLETFSTGIKTNTIDSVLATDTTDISTNSTGNIFIGTSASRTNANPIQIGTTASIVRFGLLQILKSLLIILLQRQIFNVLILIQYLLQIVFLFRFTHRTNNNW